MLSSAELNSYSVGQLAKRPDDLSGAIMLVQGRLRCLSTIAAAHFTVAQTKADDVRFH